MKGYLLIYWWIEDCFWCKSVLCLRRLIIIGWVGVVQKRPAKLKKDLPRCRIWTICRLLTRFNASIWYFKIFVDSKTYIWESECKVTAGSVVTPVEDEELKCCHSPCAEVYEYVHRERKGTLPFRYNVSHFSQRALSVGQLRLRTTIRANGEAPPPKECIVDPNEIILCRYTANTRRTFGLLWYQNILHM